MVPLQRAWTYQPQSPTGLSTNSLTQKIVLLWTGAVPFDQAKKGAEFSYSGSGMLFTPGNAGMGFDNANVGAISFGNIPPPNGAFTVFRSFTFVSKSIYTSGKITYGIPYTSAININTYLQYGTIVYEQTNVGIGPDLDVNTLFAVYPGSGSCFLSLNGGADFDIGAAPTFSTPVVCRIGANLNNPAEGVVGGCKHYLLVIWNRALSRAERTQFLLNPWQIFAPHRTLYDIGGAAPTDPVLSNLVATSITSTGAIPRVDYVA